LLPVGRRPCQVAVAFATAHRLSVDLELTLGKLNSTRQVNRDLRKEVKGTRRLATSLRAQSATLRTNHHRTSQQMIQPSNTTGTAASRSSEELPGRVASAAIRASPRLSVAGTAPQDLSAVPSAVSATPPSSAVAPARRPADDPPGHNARGQR
jgi:hypothetical protein